MPTSAASGSQAATINTEHALGAEITAPGTYVLVVNTRNLVAGDTLELRIKTRIKSGAALESAYTVSFSNVQAALNKYSVPVPSDTGLQCTLKQVAGTPRNFDWNILQL
ncbi:hypothetical protein [Azohydromonas lata]|uniref:Uncharacterized protein n=1 Tax=Azohydromonas lata TaxID=45677 RepID=A0ABU5ID04_9BURK|nr:hypothetical protein [Azohydromonas lata]MDZ5457002.1 hypothetical protein [Azohydromonas lata]